MTTETEEQNARTGIVAMQAAVRGHQVRKRLHEVKAVTSIQKYTRKYIAHRDFVKKRTSATLMQAAVRGHQVRAIKGEEALQLAAVATTQVSIESDSQQKTKKLGGSEIRGFIRSQFMVDLKGFEASKDTFLSGGVRKATFFFWQDSNSGDNTYIALANDYDYQEIAQGIKYLQSGEQSVAIVLSKIKEHLETICRGTGGSTQILIPLQQLDKEHWTLLEIVLGPSNKSGGRTNTIAKCYDSKGWASNSNFVDFWVNARRIVYVKSCVNEQFGVDIEWIREGKQGVIDGHNCGRYTLIKMGQLLRVKNAPDSIDGINRVLATRKLYNRQLADVPDAQQKTLQSTET